MRSRLVAGATGCNSLAAADAGTRKNWPGSSRIPSISTAPLRQTKSVKALRSEARRAFLKSHFSTVKWEHCTSVSPFGRITSGSKSSKAMDCSASSTCRAREDPSSAPRPQSNRRKVVSLFCWISINKLPAPMACSRPLGTKKASPGFHPIRWTKSADSALTERLLQMVPGDTGPQSPHKFPRRLRRRRNTTSRFWVHRQAGPPLRHPDAPEARVFPGRRGSWREWESAAYPAYPRQKSQRDDRTTIRAVSGRATVLA